MSSRALLALGLLSGFYLLGLGLAVALAWLPWAQLRYTGELDVGGVAAGVGALYVLWALVPPMRGRWQPPGPELSQAKAPRVCGLIEEVARAADHPMPRAVYLVNEATAFAASRPRWYGLRHEPVVSLGLPLFALLSEQELRAVVAHEFGHHVGGEVRLGPWQHRTFRAIAAALHRLDGSNVFLHLPFYAYGRLFLRLTGSASREQELRADALAARLAGPQALAGALLALERDGRAWDEYCSSVLWPTVDAGFLPPLLDGYRRFLEATRARRQAEPRSTEPAPEDTHPPLEVRLAALGIPAPRRDPRAAAAWALFHDLAAAEAEILARLLRDPADLLPKLERVGWEEWGRRVLPSIWELELRSKAGAFAGVTLLDLPAMLRDEDSWWQRLREGLNVYSPEARRRQLRTWLGQWAAGTLARAGWRVTCEPGGAPALESASGRLEPFAWVEDLASGRRSAREWAALVTPRPALPE